MPNWVYNDGTITCSNSNTAEKILQAAKEGKLLNFIKPRPSGLCGNCSCNWGIENWASKWDVFFCHGSLKNEIVELAFKTPWSPPFKAFETLLSRDDILSVEMKIDSLESGFYGSWLNSEVICHEYDFSDFM